MNNNDETKDGSLIRVAKERGLVARSATLAKRGLESLQTLDRIVRFPSDDSIGDVYLVEDLDSSRWFATFEPYHVNHRGVHLGVEKIENVIGELRVPNGKSLVLFVYDGSKSPLLSTFASDSLDGLLMFGRADDALPYISDLTALTHLNLHCALGFSNVTGLSHLSNLKSLEHLNLGANAVTDKGLSYLSGLRSLSLLDLGMTCITDAGLPHLSGLTSLSELTLWNNTHITDAGLSHLSNLGSLKRLFLHYTAVTDDGLTHLSELASLSHLNLKRTNVTDDGLAHLSSLTSLSYLNLQDTKVTDDGLSNLSNLSSLENLILSDTGVTERGIQELKAFLPDCEIIS